MPRTEVRAFRDAKGQVPIKNWLDQRERREPKVYAKCLAFIMELADKGSGMHRPHADYLRDGIYELRPSFRGIHYRILYFFSGKNVVVLSDGLKKERKVPPREIDRAVERAKLVSDDPDRYTAEFELE